MLIETIDNSGKKILFNPNEVVSISSRGALSVINLRDGTVIVSNDTIDDLQEKMNLNGPATLLG